MYFVFSSKAMFVLCLMSSIMAGAGDYAIRTGSCGAGGTMTGGALTLRGALAPAALNTTAHSTDLHLTGGSLSVITAPAGADHDGDGLADIWDVDNDGDGLDDGDEVRGTAFDPATSTQVNQADSDGDGLSDGQEALAGTNPTDATHRLTILDMRYQDGWMTLSWFARGGTAYKVRAAQSLDAVAWHKATNCVESGGFGAWNVRTNAVSLRLSEVCRFYSIAVEAD